MHIVFLLTTSLERPYGNGRCFPLVRELIQFGHDVDIVALHPNFRPEMVREFTKDRVRIHYVGQMHVREKNGVKTYFSPFALLSVTIRSTLALFYKTIVLRPDVIHIGKAQPMNGLAGLLAARLCACPLYVDCDDYEAESNNFTSPWQKRIVAWFEDRIPLKARAITVNTTFLMERYHSLGIPCQHIVHLPNGIDAERFARVDTRAVENLKQKLDLAGYKVVAYIGTLGLVNHPIDLLLQAFVKVIQKQTNAVLLLVGGGQDIEKIRTCITHLGLTKQVRLTGQVSVADIPLYYALADVTVDPVYDDVIARARWPIKIMESMMAGVPVVTGDVGDRRIILDKGQAGVLVTPGCVQSLADGILLTLETGDLARHIRQAALIHCRQWSWDRLARKLVQLYEV